MSTGSGTGTPITAASASDYCTLAELKARIDIDDSDDNAILSAVITSVSREIDKYCGRFFYQKSAETRYYTAVSPDMLFVDDLISVTTLKTDEDGDRTYERTWAATDYDLEPFNAALLPEPEPYTQITRTPLGNYYFPYGTAPYFYTSQQLTSVFAAQSSARKSIQIVGNWGWSATPSAIKEACLLFSHRIFKKKDAPFNVMGNAEVGYIRIPKLDDDVQLMLNSYRKIHFG